MKAFLLSASPRRAGNSAQLLRAVGEGLREAGHEAVFVFADDIVGAFLRDCRQCRRPDGSCSIKDEFEPAFMKQFLPSEAFIVATPIYWYGMSAQLKAFFDRMFCYIAASYPQAELVKEQMLGMRIGLVLSSEETFPTVSAGIVHQLQEFARYTRSTFVGTVHGIGNARSDVGLDPQQPLLRAHEFGRAFFTRHTSDYQIDTPRQARVWG